MDTDLMAPDLVRMTREASGRDWRQAAALAAELRERFPAEPAGYQVGAASARAARRAAEEAAILAAAAARFPERAWPLVELAWAAQARGEAAEAIRLAAVLRERHPDLPAGYHIGATCAREQGQVDAAAAILAEGAARFPAQSWVAAEAAWIASARGDTDAAMRLATDLRKTFPNTPAGYRIGVACARGRGQLDEVAAILADAAARLPRLRWLVAESMWTARLRGDNAAAGKLAAELREAFPGDPDGYRVGVQAARDQGLLDEAVQILAQGAERFPAQAWVAVERVWTDLARGDAAAALDGAAELRRKAPDDPAGYHAGVVGARHSGHFDAARDVLDEAVARLPAQGWHAAENTALRRARANRTRVGAVLDALRGAGDRWAAPVARGKVVVVLGMHRAGTSLCAQIVQKLGIDLGGPLLGPNFDNPDGYFEHKAIVAAHDRLLDSADAGWDTVWLARPSQDRAWPTPSLAEARAELARIAAEQLAAAGGRWAFKDPRTARLLPLWREVFEDLGIQPVWLVSVRDPRAVAASLQRRDGTPLPQGELLWAEHYLDILRHLGPCIAGIVHYEAWFAAPDAQLRAVAAAAGDVAADAIARARGAIRADLRNQEAGSAPFALDLARQVYAWLRADAPDLAMLQQQAGATWRRLDATAAPGAPADAPMRP